MKVVRQIFGRCWAAWSLAVFTITMLVFLIPFFLLVFKRKEPLRSYRFAACSRVWMRVFLTLIGCPLRIKGREHFARGENYVVVFNHNSFMDVPLSSPFVPGGNKTIAKAELARIPVFGLVYSTGSVLVDRNSDASRKNSYNQMKDVLASGLHMCIYPEGTRNTSEQLLKPFHNGAFRLATETGKDIIPAIIFNTRKVLPPHRGFFALPHRLQMHFLPPVQVAGLDAESLKTQVFAIMHNHLATFTRKH